MSVAIELPRKRVKRKQTGKRRNRRNPFDENRRRLPFRHRPLKTDVAFCLRDFDFRLRTEFIDESGESIAALRMADEIANLL